MERSEEAIGMATHAQRLPGVPLDVLAVALAAAAATLASFSLLEGESWWIVWLLFVPVAVAALPLALAAGRGREVARIVASVLLLFWCALALASVGLFYLPSAIVLLTATVRGRRELRRG
jgi:hypothetical protein